MSDLSEKALEELMMKLWDTNIVLKPTTVTFDANWLVKQGYWTQEELDEFIRSSKKESDK